MLYGCGILLLLLIVDNDSWCRAYPDRAGGCAGGQAAVGPPHLTFQQQIRSGTLADFGYVVTIDGVPLAANGRSLIVGPENQFLVNETHVVRVDSPEQSLKGVLIRVELPEDMNARSMGVLRPGAKTQVADACLSMPDNVAGVGHFKDNRKFWVSANLELDQLVDRFPIDVTVVLTNNKYVSTFAYTRFYVSAVSELPPRPPSAAPSDQPSGGKIDNQNEDYSWVMYIRGNEFPTSASNSPS